MKVMKLYFLQLGGHKGEINMKQKFDPDEGDEAILPPAWSPG